MRRSDRPPPAPTSTELPTCAPSAAIVAVPRTIWFGARNPWPLRSGGATEAFGLAPSTGYGWPSTFIVEKKTPDAAVDVVVA